jgi:hypothetical protein
MSADPEKYFSQVGACEVWELLWIGKLNILRGAISWERAYGRRRERGKRRKGGDECVGLLCKKRRKKVAAWGGLGGEEGNSAWLVSLYR